jgi:hypothetical protein
VQCRVARTAHYDQVGMVGFGKSFNFSAYVTVAHRKVAHDPCSVELFAHSPAQLASVIFV